MLPRILCVARIQTIDIVWELLMTLLSLLPVRARTFVSLVALRLALFSMCAIGVFAQAQSGPPYRDPKLSVDQRVADLLLRMTIDEKVAQLESAWENRTFFK